MVGSYGEWDKGILSMGKQVFNRDDIHLHAYSIQVDKSAVYLCGDELLRLDGMCGINTNVIWNLR